MKLLLVLSIIGILCIGSVAFVWAQDVHWHSYVKCFEMGKLPKVDKFSSGAFMMSCIDLNPFEK